MKFVVDIDDTLLKSDFNNGNYVLKSPIENVVNKVNEAYEKGHIIVIQTGRHWNDLWLTKQQLEEIGLKYHTLTMGKPVADYYIDDKAMLPEKFLELDI